MRAGLLVTAVALLLGAGVLAAAEWWEEEESPVVQRQVTADTESIINWESGYIQVTGMGTADMATAVNAVQALAMAEDAARVRAYAQLAEIILGFRITSDITVRDGIVEGSEQRMRLDGFIKGARVVAPPEYEWAPDGSPLVRVTVGVRMGKSHPGLEAPAPVMPAAGQPPKTLSQAVVPAVIEIEKQTVFEPYQPPALPPQPTREVKNYTGLIVNAKGLGGSPSMSPKLLTPDGKEVWGTLMVSPEYAIEYGIAGWARNLDTALQVPRSGADPLIIPAVAVRGITDESAFKTNFVISEEDAAFVRQMNERTHFLEKCNVVFIN